MKQYHYDQLEDKLVEETRYDPSELLDENAAIRASGPVKIGSKGQQMLLAARIDLDHITALKNMGYDLLSSDPAEVRRALCYVQAEQNKFLTVDGKPFSLHGTKQWV
jgi:hypothetical protein